MKRFAAACALAIAVVIACDEPVSLPPTGSISIRFASSDDAATAASLRSDPREPEPGLLDRLADRRPGEEQAEVPEVVRGAEAPAEPSSHFTEYRIRLQGPSSRDTTVSAGTTSVTLGGLSVGTYSVIVEGLVSDSIDYYGRADGV
ncbi:MAG: hypothetical protein HYW06_04085, partial [Gemmatimonadetes bacterium]|nr:hypothetical protein [Gemmatimonadota bacterium]